MTAEPPRAWEQQPDEPNDAFSRFLLYLHLGPGRTLRLAYGAYLDTFPNRTVDKKGKKSTPNCAPGHWNVESSTYRWRDRAYAYDCSVFQQYGEKAVVKFIGALDLVATKACEALADPDFVPKTWRDVVDALAVIQAYANPETVTERRKRGEDSADESRTAGGTPLSCLAERPAPIPVERLIASVAGSADDGVT